MLETFVKYSSRYEISMTSTSLPKMILIGESNKRIQRSHVGSLARSCESHFQILLKFPAFTRVPAGIVIFTLCVLLSRRSELSEISASGERLSPAVIYTIYVCIYMYTPTRRSPVTFFAGISNTLLILGEQPPVISHIALCSPGGNSIDRLNVFMPSGCV